MEHVVGNIQAFPKAHGFDGMTLRDYFAGQALIGIIEKHSFSSIVDNPELASTYSYKIADAMLKERKE